MIHLQCDNAYCAKCLKELFIQSIRNKSLFPPRCCQKIIPRSIVIDYLSASEFKDFEEAELEYSMENKTYCSNTSCGKFVSPQQIKGTEATCKRCSTKTCTTCGNASHSYDCPEDPNIEATMALASMLNWQRCRACGAMVEREHGCNHMTLALLHSLMQSESKLRFFYTDVHVERISAIDVDEHGKLVTACSRIKR